MKTLPQKMSREELLQEIDRFVGQCKSLLAVSDEKIADALKRI